MNPPFDTDFEYDSWFDREQERRLLEEYFGESIKFYGGYDGVGNK